MTDDHALSAPPPHPRDHPERGPLGPGPGEEDVLTDTRRGILRRAALASCATLVALLLAEGLYRGWRALTGDAYDGAATAAAIREIASGVAQSLQLPGEDIPNQDVAAQATEVIVLHPYLGYDTRASVQRVMLEREAHLQRPDRFEVMILGGSVAALFGTLGAPRLLELLAADPRLAGREIYLLEFGRTTFKQPQQQMMLAYLLSLGFRPDAVVNIDGFNEVTVPPVNATQDVHPVHPLGDFWKSIATLGPDGVAGLGEYLSLLRGREDLQGAAESSLGRGLHHSAVLGTWSLGSLRRRQTALAERTRAYLDRLGDRDTLRELFGPRFDGDTEAAVQLGVEVWAEGSLNLHAMCRARDIPYLHVLQPTLHDEGSKPMTDAERHNARLKGLWLEGCQLGYPRMRAMAEVLRDHGVAFLDATGVFREVTESIYLDACHFDARGNALLAEAIAPALLATLPAELVTPPRLLEQGEKR